MKKRALAALLALLLAGAGPECQVAAAPMQDCPPAVALTFDDGPNGACTEALLRLLADKAAELDCAFIATGHYARIEVDSEGLSRVLAAEDAEADQSAVLADLPQEILAKLVLPLGDFTKADVEEMLAETAE